MLHEFPLNLAINTPKYEMVFIAVLMNLHNIQKETLELRYCVHEEKIHSVMYFLLAFTSSFAVSALM